MMQLCGCDGADFTNGCCCRRNFRYGSNATGSVHAETAQCPLRSVISTGRCNTLVKSLCWRLEV